MKLEIEFFKFKDKEPKLTFEDTLITDEDGTSGTDGFQGDA